LVLLSRVRDAGRRPPRRHRRKAGQSLVEFALVVPVLLLMIGGVVQLGVIFAAKNSLVQAARDTARWAATQTYLPCSNAAIAAPPQPLTQADTTATRTGLIGYSSGMWDSAAFTAYADNVPLPATAPNQEGVEVVWSYASGTCPTTDNTVVAYVTVRLTHTIPLFLPGLWLIAGGTCDGAGCHMPIDATSMFRMEPPPP
jgi:Flp pilus assembly protein TadG